MSKETKPPIRERLRSALNREIRQEPQAPAPTFSPWADPPAAYLPNEAEARVAGAIAWAERVEPSAPQYGRQDL